MMDPRFRIDAPLRCGLLVLAVALISSCATGRQQHVPIEKRPTPIQPDGTVPEGTSPSRPSSSESSPAATGSQVAADTLAARTALRRCAGRRLLPEQESSIESMEALLARARSALIQGDVVGAASFARQARQLGRSLGCP